MVYVHVEKATFEMLTVRMNRIASQIAGHTRLFAQKPLRASNKENIIVLYYWHLGEEIHPWSVDCPDKISNNAESVFMYSSYS